MMPHTLAQVGPTCLFHKSEFNQVIEYMPQNVFFTHTVLIT